MSQLDLHFFFLFCDRDSEGAKCWWEKGRTHILEIDNDNYHHERTSPILMAGRGICCLSLRQVQVSVSGRFLIPNAKLNPSANPQILEEYQFHSSDSIGTRFWTKSHPWILDG